MGSISGGFQYLFRWDHRLTGARNLAAENGIILSGSGVNPINAIEHAYLSATIQKYDSAYFPFARVLGNALEADATLRFMVGGTDRRLDSFKDL